MQIVICCIFLFISHVAGKYAQWQTVDKMALKIIFGNVSTVDPADFSVLAKYDDVAAQCEGYAKIYDQIDPLLDASWIRDDPNPSQAKINMTSQGCKDYFTHRQWVQKWADFLFHELTVDNGDESKEMILKPWHSAHLKSLFWYIDSKYHYIFSCTMLKFMATVIDGYDPDEASALAFINTVKSIQDLFYGPSMSDDMEDPKNNMLFKINEQQLRGSGSYLYDLLSSDFIKDCTYESETITDFSPNSWQNVFTDLGETTGNLKRKK